MASSKAAANYRLPRGGWDDPNCARPTRAFSCRALREQGDRPSYSAPLFSIPLDLQLGDGGNEQIEKMPISRRTLLAFRDKLDRNFE